MHTELVLWSILLLPLFSAVIIGSVGHRLSKQGISLIALASMSISFALTSLVSISIFKHGIQWQIPGFVWLAIGKTFKFQSGLLIDPLSITLMLVVTSVSLIVHLYSLAYMEKDPSYSRYFSYLALFTFSMLLLVSADNSLQLFFGWEAVGLTSYLLIGFWFQKAEAGRAALKAFLINRAGDIGLLLGIALLIVYSGSPDYLLTFKAIAHLSHIDLTLFGYSVSLLNIVGILLFLGAMSKSAQIPLQVWLPDSMVGPTPVSALMHAATMVTAGVYMVVRLAPIFEQAPLARAFILLVGSTTALFLGIVSLVQTDIKRAIAFSTISQLGYMVTGLGVSAYTASILHLVTHAYFKALLFLAAGSIILALHHEQSLNKMGQLWKRLPITYGCFILGAFALVGLPPFSGFYSKDLILTAVYEATRKGSLIHHYAFYSLLAGVWITALYTGRLIFLIFHAPSKLSSDDFSKLKEPTYRITLPLIVLSIPTITLGWILMYGFSGQWMEMLNIYTFSTRMPLHNAFIGTLSAILGATGLVMVCLCYTMWPLLLAKGPLWGNKIHQVVLNQYWLEKLHQKTIITIIQRLAKQFATIDTLFIDRLLVQGSTRLVQWIAKRLQLVQSGWLYQYLLIMVMALVLFLIGVIIRA